MKTSAIAVLALFGATACGAAASAEAIKLPVASDDKGTVYVTPNVTSTETSVNSKGATIGVERPDGSGAYGGVDTSTDKPTYSGGVSSGGNVSFSAGAQSSSRDNTGVRAGIKIKF